MAHKKCTSRVAGLALDALRCYKPAKPDVGKPKKRAQLLKMTSMTPAHGLFTSLAEGPALYQRCLDFLASDPSALSWQKHKIGHQFRDKNWLLKALTHTSFVHEHGEQWSSNERLEFLGDSVLGLIVTHELSQKFTDMSEGELSKLRSSLVNEELLAEFSGVLEVGHCLLLGKGETKERGAYKTSVLADAFEALLGAIYRDSDFETAQRVFSLWVELFEASTQKIFYDAERLKVFDAKTRLQELTMKEFKQLPEYSCLQDGDEFAGDVKVLGQVLACTREKSKKKLMRKLAKLALTSEALKSLVKEKETC